MNTLVDTNLLIDIVLDDKIWADRSLRAIREASNRGDLTINIVVYAELAAGYGGPEELDALLAAWRITVVDVPRRATFLSGKAFKRYRAAGGARTGVLPDFLIGAHAESERLPLLTRDPRRYRTYFPNIELIVPAT